MVLQKVDSQPLLREWAKLPHMLGGNSCLLLGHGPSGSSVSPVSTSLPCLFSPRPCFTGSGQGACPTLMHCADPFHLRVVDSRSVMSDSCDPMDCSPPGSSVYGIFQARILEWVVIASSKVPSQVRDHTLISCTGKRILYQTLSLIKSLSFIEH